MVETVPERKLAAILHADVVGYSRLMGEDETGTHRQVTEYLDAFAAAITDHQGRVVNYAGDAVLAEFPTVTDALTCAVAVQRDLKTRNDTVPAARKIQFRIGVNLGEVIVDRNDIYGDGVNVAARLEGLAEPAGICISESVRDAIGSKLPYHYQSMGKQQVKNIARPVRAYQVLLNADATAAKTGKPWRAFTLLGLVAVVIGAAGVIMWLHPWQPEPVASPPPSVVRSTDKPSIAVLPFHNISADPEQDYFADGMASDLITDLSKVSGLFVIARNSVFAYKGKRVDAKQVGKELGVRYLLEGDVRKAGGRIRINAQLIDAVSGGHLWAERYDRKLEDIFALQDDVIQKIVTALAVQLTQGEQQRLARRPTDSIEAYDVFLRGQEHYSHYTRDSNQRARLLFQQAIDVDENFARAYAGLSLTYANAVFFGWTNDSAAVLERALALARKAIGLDAELPQSYWALGYAYLFNRQHDLAIAALNNALAVDPNYADSYGLLGSVNAYMGQPNEAIHWLENGRRLNPHTPAEYWGAFGRSYYVAKRFDKALALLQTALDINPNYLNARLHLAAVCVRLGQQDDAEWEASEVVVVDPNFSLARWADSQPYKDPALLQDILDDLRQAGLH